MEDAEACSGTTVSASDIHPEKAAGLAHLDDDALFSWKLMLCLPPDNLAGVPAPTALCRRQLTIAAAPLFHCHPVWH